MIYQFSAYRKGSTNGQRPYAYCFVSGAADKAEAQQIALKHMRAYKVLGWRLPKGMALEEHEATLQRLYPGAKIDKIEA